MMTAVGLPWNIITTLGLFSIAQLIAIFVYIYKKTNDVEMRLVRVEAGQGAFSSELQTMQLTLSKKLDENEKHILKLLELQQKQIDGITQRLDRFQSRLNGLSTKSSGSP